MNTHDSLQWRYAAKKLIADKQVPEEDLEYILQAGNLAATSYGLQPFSIIVVTDEETKLELLKHAYNQVQVSENSHLIVLAAATNVDEEYISEYTSRMERERGLESGALDGFKKVMVGDLTNRSQEERITWSQKQAYIALGSMMIAAGEKEVDGCPMEGFSNDEFDRILGLSEMNLRSTALFPIGYRSPEDESQNYKKVRKGLEDLVEYK
jgi:nitroreductase